MKKYNAVMAGMAVIWLLFSIVWYNILWRAETEENLQYKVEINEIMKGLEAEGGFSSPDFDEMEDKMEYIKEVSFLPAEEAGEEESLKKFYRNRNGRNTAILPLFGDGLSGYVRFDYCVEQTGEETFWLVEGIWTAACLFLLAVLWYIGNRILKPFHVLSEMPYELAKGHLQGELEENRSRFFGKFVWGISMLRDTLRDSRNREFKLEKEKKLLLLSLSHDIKIPLSAIKLYAKALEEGVYHTPEEKEHAVKQIGNHARKIEEYVRDIVAASSEDILVIDVKDSEFYLKDYVEKIKRYYEPKCRLKMLELEIGAYENKLLKGDMDRAVEVMENLLENALKYGDGERIAITFYEEDYCQIVRVFNTGDVVSAEEMPHLFDSFFRGSNAGSRSGNGLGLYISRQIMNRMEGDIFAVREKEGMSFCLVFRM